MARVHDPFGMKAGQRMREQKEAFDEVIASFERGESPLADAYLDNIQRVLIQLLDHKRVTVERRRELANVAIEMLSRVKDARRNAQTEAEAQREMERNRAETEALIAEILAGQTAGERQRRQ